MGSYRTNSTPTPESQVNLHQVLVRRRLAQENEGQDPSDDQSRVKSSPLDAVNRRLLAELARRSADVRMSELARQRRYVRTRGH